MGKLLYLIREHEHACERCGIRWTCEFGQFCDGINLDELCIECAYKDIQEKKEKICESLK